MDDNTLWAVTLFSLGVFVISLVLRRTLERLFPTVRKDTPESRAQHIWEEVLLPSMPVFVGVLMALVMRQYPYPALLTGLGSRLTFGAVAGFFCGWTYRIVKALVTKKFGIDVPDPLATSERPPP